MLVVVQQRERNEVDQRTIEFSITTIEPRCRTRRYTLEEVAAYGSLDEQFNLYV